MDSPSLSPVPDIDPDIRDLFFPGQRQIDIQFYVYVSYLRKYAQVHAIMTEPTLEFVEMGLEEYKIESSWTVPTALEMDHYRESASRFDRESGNLLVDNILLRDLIVIHHLRQLKLPVEIKDPSFKNEFENPLSRKTLDKIKQIHSGMYDILYSKFTTDACLAL
jgi:hypothetical protein